MGGVIDGTGIALVMLLLGSALFQAMRKRTIKGESGRFTGTGIFLTVARLPNVVVLAIVNALCLVSIVVSGQHIGESALIYILVPFTWFFGIVADRAGGIAASLKVTFANAA